MGWPNFKITHSAIGEWPQVRACDVDKPTPKAIPREVVPRNRVASSACRGRLNFLCGKPGLRR